MKPFKISIVSVFPELHEQFLKTSLIGRAVQRGQLSATVYKMSDVCKPGERIDDAPCGPGAGMVIKPEVVDRLMKIVEEEQGPGVRIFFSPQGDKLDQPMLKKLSGLLFAEHAPSPLCKELSRDDDLSKQDLLQGLQHRHIILFCSRYEGADERVWDEYADVVLSIGDYVLMGGDVAAHVFLEGLLRFLPGVVGKAASVEHDSFSSSFLDYPTYTLPTLWHERDVPEIVLSGNHEKIRLWREQRAAEKTVRSRFDWFAQSKPSEDDIARAQQFIPHHYVALMHTQINIKGGRVGESSVTSLDIHDIARSSATYAVKNYFVVTPLQDQRKIVSTFLDFWHSKKGREYNQSRYDAVERVQLAHDLDAAVAAITQKEGQPPVIIATSAQHHANAQTIDYHSQSVVWAHDRPVLLVFGTAQGLADEVLDRCDYILLPVKGMSDYNHLSVRSAVAIILDRWLGLHPQI